MKVYISVIYYGPWREIDIARRHSVADNRESLSSTHIREGENYYE